MERLKIMREDNVLSQRELARLAGVTHATLWRLEHGYAAQPRTIRKIAEALGVEPKKIIKRREDSYGH